MEEILILATVLTPVTTGLVEVVKKSVTGLSSQFYPITALGLGIVLGLTSFPFTDLSLDLRLWAGGLAGLSAMGLFDLTSSAKKQTHSK